MNSRGRVAPAGSPDGTDGGRLPPPQNEQHIDQIASAVCELLGTRAKPRLAARLHSAPHVLDDADDICQLAALAFVDAYRAGRIAPDADGSFSARGVAAYAWGICNRIFCDTVRRKRPQILELLESDVTVGADTFVCQDSTFADMSVCATEADDRLWGVLESVAGKCRPEDIVMAYLLASGASVGAVQQVLRVSRNTPANALKRVGKELQRELGLGPTVEAAASRRAKDGDKLSPPQEESE